MQRCQSLEIFFWTSTPSQQNLSMQPPLENFFFLFGPPSLSNFMGKMWVYLSGTSICWILIQLGSRLYSCLQWTTCILQENEARNWNTSTRSLEFWNIWSLSLSFLWATDPNFLLSGSSGHPYGRVGDWLRIWVTRR